MDEAIKAEEGQDVSADEQQAVEVEEQGVDRSAEQAEEVTLSPREQKLKDIAERQRGGDEYATRPDLVASEQHSEEDRELNPETDGGVEQDLAPESPVYLNEDGEWVSRLKVNGVDVERRYDTITATAQKHESADQRLQEAGQRIQTADDRHKQLDEYEQMLRNEQARIEAAKQEHSQLSEQDAGVSGSSEEIEALLEQIYDGNKEEAAVKLGQLINGRQEPTLDVAAITQQATNNAVEQMQKESEQKAHQDSIQDGIDWLRATHPEIESDDMLKQFIDTQTAVVMREDPSLAPKDVIKKAAGDVLTRMGSSTPSSREDLKSQMKKQPQQQSSSAYIPPKAKAVDNSPEAVLARMRKNRNTTAGRPA